MSDIRCPMCGKSNPSDLEVCQFCEARLKPLVGLPADEDSYQDRQKDEAKDEPFVPVGSQETGVNLTDWLQSLRVDDETPSSSTAEEDLNAWLAAEGVEAQVEADPSEVEGENDWLDNLRQDGDTGDLSSGLDETGEGWFAEDSSTDGLPAWLSSNDGITGDDSKEALKADTADSSEQSAVEDGETPEWLRRVRARRKAEDSDEVPDLIQPEQQAEDASFWVDESKEPALIDDQQEEPFTPDWLSELSDESTDQDAEFIEDDTASAAGISPEFDENKVEALSPPPFTEEGDIPDWATDDHDGEIEQGGKKEISSEEVPEWLSKLEEAAGIEPESVDSSLEEPPAIDVNALDDEDQDSLPIDAEEEESEIVGVNEAAVPFALAEIPEVVAEDDISQLIADLPDQDSVEGVDGTSGEEDQLTPGELPGWLEAMRPVESAVPDVPAFEDDDKRVEGGGPLAGLRGVLPAEQEIAQLKKPTVYTSRLIISENDRLNATILTDLIRDEKRTQPLPSSPVLSSQQVLRWSIFALLSIAILWYVFTGSQNVPLPTLSSSIIDVSDIINGLPESSPVLLAVDYEPGISGEMEAASAGVIDHLMIKGSYLTLVSTAVTGPAQAERMLNNISSSMGHQYQSPDQYRNLGYIPGGAIGLSGFSEAPRQVLPYSLDGERVWESSALTGIDSLADFMLVLVLTEDPETARTWIEQVQPTLDGTPLVFVISAQAEPMVRPYYQGFPQQVQGFVAGLAGGAAYESGLPRTNLGRIYWDAYSFTVWLAVLLILIGGAVTFTTSQFAKRNQAKGDIAP